MKWLVLLLGLVACSRESTQKSIATPPPPPPPSDASTVVERGDAPAIHGMALFGESTVFASHLPMFHAPHNFQVVLELSLANDPRTTKRAFHTISPAPFVLERAHTPGFVMDVEVFEGHFERGGKSLGSTKATIKRVIRFNGLVADTPRPPAPRFFLVGTPEEAYLLHTITTRPDFDQILRVKVPQVIDGDHAVTKAPLAVNDVVQLGTVSATVEAELYQEHSDLE